MGATVVVVVVSDIVVVVGTLELLEWKNRKKLGEFQKYQKVLKKVRVKEEESLEILKNWWNRV